MAHRTKKCKHCLNRHEVKKSLQTPAGFFCSIGHAIEFAKNAHIRSQAKKRDKEVRLHQQSIKTAHKANKESKKTDLKYQHRLTQKSFNKMRVLQELLWFGEKGLEPTCISCNKPKGNDVWCCGHFKTRGSSGALRYDTDNTFLQHNHRCNMQLSGDIAGTAHTRGLKKGLLERFGQQEGQRIIKHCEQHHDSVKWQWHELENCRKEYNAQIRILNETLSKPKFKPHLQSWVYSDQKRL